MPLVHVLVTGNRDLPINKLTIQGGWHELNVEETPRRKKKIPIIKYIPTESKPN